MHLGRQPAPEVHVRVWLRDRSLGVFFISLFLVSWVGQLFFEWRTSADEERVHGATPVFWSLDFQEAFWQSTLENWQSEFLQIATFTIAAGYLVWKGSSESPDSDERVEAKLDALLEHSGLDPTTIEKTLQSKFHRRR
jgi:hypothetical protein